MTNFITSQTHPNRGSITILSTIKNDLACGPFKFYVNNQSVPGIGSSQAIKYECEGLQAESIEELANLLALVK